VQFQLLLEGLSAWAAETVVLEAEMNFHHYNSQPYFRQKVDAHFSQHIRKQKGFSWSGDRRLWFALGKTLFVLSPLLLLLNLWLVSHCAGFDYRLQVEGKVRQQLISQQVNLKVKKQQVSSPERVRLVAAERLALHVPEKEQVKHF
jgi:hypothetical protein